jgi:hypothetical protein
VGSAVRCVVRPWYKADHTPGCWFLAFLSFVGSCAAGSFGRPELEPFWYTLVQGWSGAAVRSRCPRRAWWRSLMRVSVLDTCGDGRVDLLMLVSGASCPTGTQTWISGRALPVQRREGFIGRSGIESEPYALCFSPLLPPSAFSPALNGALLARLCCVRHSGWREWPPSAAACWVVDVCSHLGFRFERGRVGGV